MNLHKYLTALLLFFSLNLFSAGIPKDLANRVSEAISEFRYYEITFERMFKYPMESDTLAEEFVSRLYFQTPDAGIGTHRISYLRSGNMRSLIACNLEGMYRLNFRENMYYATLKKDNEKLLQQNMRQNLYKPFTYSRAELLLFSEAGKDEAYIYLEKKDTGRAKNGTLSYTSTCRISIDRKNYLPVREETVTLSGNKVQYSMYRLKSHRMLGKDSYAQVLRSADSLAAVIRTHTDADSVKKSRSGLYRKPKLGDTASFIEGTFFTGGKFDSKVLKDSVVVLDFFYTTCAPCITAVPEINYLVDSFGSRGVDIYAVNPFDTDWGNVNAYTLKYGVKYPVIQTGKQAVYDYGVTGYPRMFVIKNGIIVKIFFGFTKGSMAKEVAPLLEQLIR